MIGFKLQVKVRPRFSVRDNTIVLWDTGDLVLQQQDTRPLPFAHGGTCLSSSFA
jgi:hypothetical protein